MDIWHLSVSYGMSGYRPFRRLTITGERMLLNIDKPHRKSTLHTESCPHVPNPLGTVFKPLELVGRDGGWFSVSSVSDAKTIAKRELPIGEFVRCSYC
jgi:hypothetical protein